MFLHLSKIESFGNVYLEAISSGLPIVAYDSPRTRWIVGENEYLTSCDNPDDIARQIELAKEERSNNKQVRALRAREFSWRKVAEKYQAFLHEVARSE